MRRVLLLGLFFLVFQVACGSQTTVAPTPFPALPGTVPATIQGPIALTLTELAAAPGLYKDTQIQLTGQFFKLPLLICDAETYPLPSSWGLAEAGITIPAGGFDQQMRALLPEGILVTAEGRWRQWQGVVGCGKQAQLQELWYLDVSRILSPSPLAQVTLTPPNGESIAAIEEMPESNPGQDEPFDFSLTPVGSDIDIITESNTPIGPPGEEFPEPTPPSEAYPGETTGGLPEATPVNPDDAEEPVTPVPGTATVLPGTPDATATGSPGIITPTPTSGTVGPSVDQGNLINPSAEFVSTTLPASTTHSWSLEMYEGESFTISAIAPPPANLILSVVRNGQFVINRQNNAPAGMPEVVTVTSTADLDTVQILVETEGGVQAEYAVLAYLDEDFPVLAVRGMITAGNPQANVVIEPDTVDYWFFVAEGGRNLTVLLNPDPQADAIFYLYGPGAEYIDLIDNGFEGDEEIFQDVLPETGLYAIRLYEFNYSRMTYRLTVTFQ